MLNPIARAIRTHWRGPCVSLFFRSSSFTTRDIFYEKSDEAGTLLSRFAKHIALEQQVYLPILPTTINYASYYPVTDNEYFRKELQRTPADQLPALIIFTFTYRSNADPNKLVFVLNELDDAAVRHLPNMSDDTAIRTLYSFLFLMPNWIARTNFYHLTVKRLAEQEFTENTPKEKFVQLCFYLGLTKKQNIEKNKLLKRLLSENLERYLPQLNTMDLGVISSAAFKTATPVQCTAYNEMLERETCTLPMDEYNDALLVTFIKAMRFQRVRSEKVCEHLGRLSKNPDAVENLQTSGLAHLLAYFSEMSWDKKEDVKPFVDEFTKRIGKGKEFRSQKENIRGKDYAMFLWSCAQLNYQPDDGVLNRIEEILLEKADRNEFHYFPDQLVDCCLSLWTLGHKSRKLLQETVTLKLDSRPNAREQPKVDSRLTVLLTAASIEMPKSVPKSINLSEKQFNVNTPVPAYFLKGRSDLTAYIVKLANESNISEVKVTCPINGINIPGLYVKLNDGSKTLEYFVEMLTPNQTMRFSGKPNALLRLKMRLLAALNYKVVLLRSNEMENNQLSFKDLVVDGDKAAILEA